MSDKKENIDKDTSKKYTKICNLEEPTYKEYADNIMTIYTHIFSVQNCENFHNILGVIFNYISSELYKKLRNENDKELYTIVNPTDTFGNTVSHKHVLIPNDSFVKVYKMSSVDIDEITLFVSAMNKVNDDNNYLCISMHIKKYNGSTYILNSYGDVTNLNKETFPEFLTILTKHINFIRNLLDFEKINILNQDNPANEYYELVLNGLSMNASGLHNIIKNEENTEYKEMNLVYDYMFNLSYEDKLLDTKFIGEVINNVQ